MTIFRNVRAAIIGLAIVTAAMGVAAGSASVTASCGAWGTTCVR